MPPSPGRVRQVHSGTRKIIRAVKLRETGGNRRKGRKLELLEANKGMIFMALFLIGAPVVLYYIWKGGR